MICRPHLLLSILVALGVVAGLGASGYRFALQHAIDQLKPR